MANFQRRYDKQIDRAREIEPRVSTATVSTSSNNMNYEYTCQDDQTDIPLREATPFRKIFQAPSQIDALFQLLGLFFKYRFLFIIH